MNAFEVSARLATILDEDGIAYAIGGAIALTAWAIPRDTSDVDISLFVDVSELARAFDSLERAGVMIDRADARRSVERIGMFTGRLGRTLVDAFVGDHPHFHAMRARRQQLAYPSGQLVWFVSAEDLCVLKLLYGRLKDLGDLERLLAALPDLDIVYIREWAAKLPVTAATRDRFDDLVRRFRPASG
jgi:hypothetical protein